MQSRSKVPCTRSMSLFLQMHLCNYQSGLKIIFLKIMEFIHPSCRHCLQFTPGNVYPLKLLARETSSVSPLKVALFVVKSNQHIYCWDPSIALYTAIRRGRIHGCTVNLTIRAFTSLSRYYQYNELFNKGVKDIHIYLVKDFRLFQDTLHLTTGPTYLRGGVGFSHPAVSRSVSKSAKYSISDGKVASFCCNEVLK